MVFEGGSTQEERIKLLITKARVKENLKQVGCIFFKAAEQYSRQDWLRHKKENMGSNSPSPCLAPLVNQRSNLI